MEESEEPLGRISVRLIELDEKIHVARCRHLPTGGRAERVKPFDTKLTTSRGNRLLEIIETHIGAKYNRPSLADASLIDRPLASRFNRPDYCSWRAQVVQKPRTTLLTLLECALSILSVVKTLAPGVSPFQ